MNQFLKYDLQSIFNQKKIYYKETLRLQKQLKRVLFNYSITHTSTFCLPKS